MIFINPAEGMMPRGISEWLAEDIVSLAARPENPLTHFALPIPPSQKQNLEQAVDRTKQFGPLGRYMTNPEFSKILDEPMPYFMNREKFLELLEKLRSRKVEFVLYGAESGLTGENIFDSQRTNLLKFFRENPETRTLVFGTFTTGQVFSRADLTSGRDQTHSSLVKALSEAGLKQADIASVSTFEINEMDWLENSELYQLYNLADFLNRYQVNSSFALELRQGEVPLSILLFAPQFRELYGQAWDAIIFYTKDHRKDPDFFIRPKAPRSTGLDVPSKSVLAVRAEVREGKRAESRVPRVETASRFQEKYAVVVDMKVFGALSPEQRSEFYKLMAHYQEGERVKFVFPVTGDRELDTVWEELSDRRAQFGNVEIPINPAGFDFQGRKVIHVSKEGIQGFYATLVEEKLRGSKDFYSVRYKQGTKDPGLLTAALLLLDSGKNEFFQGRSFSDIPQGLGLEYQIQAILGAYLYVGRSA